MSSADAHLRQAKRLIDALESADAFERLQSIEELALLTQQRLDFAWRGTAEERALSVARWRKWLAREEKKRKGGLAKAAAGFLGSVEIPLGSGQNLQAALEKAFKDLPPEHKKALIAQMLAKVAADSQASASHDPCDRCKKRPATVKITARDKKGEFQQVSLCEVCAAKDGA
jgi:hypothetical protein